MEHHAAYTLEMQVIVPAAYVVFLAVLAGMVGLLAGLMRHKPGPSPQLPTAHVGPRMKRRMHPVAVALCAFFATLAIGMPIAFAIS